MKEHKALIVAAVTGILLLCAVMWRNFTADDRDTWKRQAEDLAENYYKHLVPELAKSDCMIDELNMSQLQGTLDVTKETCLKGAKVKASSISGHPLSPALLK